MHVDIMNGTRDRTYLNEQTIFTHVELATINKSYYRSINVQASSKLKESWFIRRPYLLYCKVRTVIENKLNLKLPELGSS